MCLQCVSANLVKCTIWLSIILEFFSFNSYWVTSLILALRVESLALAWELSPWPWPWESWPWPWPWGLCPWPCLGLGGYVLVNITVADCWWNLTTWHQGCDRPTKWSTAVLYGHNRKYVLHFSGYSNSTNHFMAVQNKLDVRYIPRNMCSVSQSRKCSLLFKRWSSSMLYCRHFNGCRSNANQQLVRHVIAQLATQQD